MTSDSKLKANRENAKRSTGPSTPAGREKSSRNALSLGLYTRQDYVKPEERAFYKEFCETMHAELTPAGLLEESLVSEITAATWRLRRCHAAEAILADSANAAGQDDPLLDESTEKKRKGIERARAAAHSLLHRSINQLRKLQTERVTRAQLGLGNTEDTPLADSRQVCQALNLHERNRKLFEGAQRRELDNLMASAATSGDLASICEEPPLDEAALRHLDFYKLCSCGSRKLNRSCCGKSDYENQKKAA